MAWQNSAAMAGNGAGPAGGGEGSNGQPQGTEYTLQGVMRFLQTEWHKHERLRNSWDIERAEMKSRISRLEGDYRTAKRLQESLGKHVKLLENALRREREKNKKLQAGEPLDSASMKDDQVKGDAKTSNSTANLSGLGQDDDDDILNQSEIKQDVEREKSRLYLGKCIQEITYHVVPTTVVHQALAEEQEHLMQNHQFANHVSPQSLEEMYAQQQRQKEVNHVAMANQPAANHQVPSVVPRVSELPSLSRAPPQSDQPAFAARAGNEAQGAAQSGQSAAVDTRSAPRTSYEFPSTNEESVEKVSHSYDVYGQQIPTRAEETSGRVSEDTGEADTDGWNFEDSSDPPHDEPPPDYAPTQRPDTDAFPSAQNLSIRTSPRGGGHGSRRKSSISKRRQSDGSHELRELSLSQGGAMVKGENASFKVRFACRGHLDVVRSVIFTGGGTPAEPEICTAGDDGVVKRWIIPATYVPYGPHGGASANDLDISSYFTHRGHTGAVMCLAASPASQNFLNGGRALGDGWVFSGGQDSSVRVWERGRVDPKATLDGHTDAVWTICVLPGSSASILGDQSNRHGGADRMLLATGSADGTILIWAVSSPPQLTSPSTGSRRGAGGSRRANSVSSGSNFPSSPQPSTATSTPFHYSLVHRIERMDHPSPTCIFPLSMAGDNFVVSYNDASVLIYDTRTAEEIVGMASQETYNQTLATGVNAIAATKAGLEAPHERDRGSPDDEVHGATGSSSGATGSGSGVEGMILSGHEDRYIRFFDANSGQCTYTMLAHPAAIAALSLSPDGRELVSAGHDASLRFWSLEKRSCTQEINSHRLLRGEGVCAVVWSADGRWVISGGGDGVVKVWSR